MHTHETARSRVGKHPIVDPTRQRLGVSLAARPPSSEICQDHAMLSLLLDCQSGLDPKEFSHLSPYLDSCKLWRVGGRLRNAFIPFDGKHPILVPKEAPLARVLVVYFHEAVWHQGRMITHSLLRAKGYYIPGARE